MASRYFNWLVRRVSTREQAKKYSKLLEELDMIDFEYVGNLDLNRVADAVEMRAKYEQDNHLERVTRPVSCLEVFVALAIHCEDGVMGEWDKGDRTGDWFWIMMENSGLIRYDDRHYDEEMVLEIIDRIMKRKYNRDGSNGGLFYIPDISRDLRKTELWSQLMWYLNHYNIE